MTRASGCNLRTIATWYYENAPNEGGEYPQVPWATTSPRFRDTYRRCLPVFFASARAANPEASLALFVNKPLQPDSPVGEAAIGVLAELGVQVHTLEYTSAPPPEWPSNWRNQFYVLDVMRFLAQATDDDALTAVLDADVVWTSQGAAAEFWSTLSDARCLTYDLGFDPGHHENGLSGEQLGEIFAGLTGTDVCTLPYLGGELQAARGDMLRSISSTADSMWRSCRDDRAHGRSTIAEEAHLLTMVYKAERIASGGANRFIKRCWTQRLKYSNIDGSEEGLAMWHTPAEKQFGLRRLYHEVTDKGAGAWMDRHSGDLRQHLGEVLGIPEVSARKWATDLALRVPRIIDRGQGFLRRR